MALVLAIDPTRIISGAAQAKAALSGVKSEAAKVEAATNKLGSATDSLGGATGRVSGFLGKFKGQMQSAGYQVGDFAVQVGAGTSAAQALGQQLPQLLGSFGAVGAIMGAVAAIGIPLAAAFYNSAGGAKSLSGATDEATDKLDAFRAAVDNANISGAELTQTYGAAALAVASAFDQIAAQKSQEAQRAIDGVSASLDELFSVSGRGGRGRTISNMFDLGVMSLASEEARNLTAEFSAQQDILAGADGNLRLQLDTLAAMYQTTIDLANATGGVSEAEQGVIDGIGTAIDLVSQQIALTGEIEGATWSIEGAANAAAAAMGNIGAAAASSYGAVAALASKAWEAASAKVAAAQGNTYAIRDAQNAGMKGRGQPAVNYSMPSDWNKPVRGGGGGGGGRKSAGGGGISEAEKASNAYDSLIASLDPAERATQDLAKAQETVNAALKVGAISADEAANAMKLAGEKYSVAGDMWGEFQNAGGNALDRLIDGTATLGEALKDMVKEMVIAIAKKKLLASVEGGSAGDSLGGLIFRGLTGGFAGLFDSGGTIGAGKTGIVGERGPEMVTAKSSGAVVTSRVDTARQLGRQSGGGVVMGEIKVSVADDGKIQAYVQRMGIQAAGAAVSQVKGSLQGWSTQLRTDGALV
jgi:hypothetical protein